MVRYWGSSGGGGMAQTGVGGRSTGLPVALCVNVSVGWVENTILDSSTDFARSTGRVMWLRLFYHGDIDRSCYVCIVPLCIVGRTDWRGG